jgi:hypothetical protein
MKIPRLEKLSPELIEQTIRALLDPSRDLAIAQRLEYSDKLLDLACHLAYAESSSDAGTLDLARLLAAIAAGMEVGYELGTQQRSKSGDGDDHEPHVTKH